MKNNIQRYKLPLIFFILIVFISTTSITAVRRSQLNHNLFILALFSITGIHIKTRLQNSSLAKNNIEKYILIMSLILGLITSFFIVNYIPFSFVGAVTFPYYGYFILSLIILNFIIIILSINWKSPGILRKLGLFLIKLIALAILTTMASFIIALSLSKEADSTHYIRIVEQMLFMGILPIALILILPDFSFKNTYKLNPIFTISPVILMFGFMSLSIINPSPYQPEEYVAYLEDKHLWKQGQIQANPHLNLEERQKFVAYSQKMSNFELPEELSIINEYFQGEYQDKDKIEAEFIEQFGFSPLTLIHGYQPQAENPEQFIYIRLKNEAQDKLLEQNIHWLHNKKIDLSRELKQSSPYQYQFKIDNHEFIIKAEIMLNPDSYSLSLLDSQGNTLQSIFLSDILKARLSSDSEYLATEKLIFPFKNNEVSGYLSIPFMSIKPLNQDTYIELNIAFAREGSPFPERNVRIDNNNLIIHGQYDSIISFYRDDFNQDEWQRDIQIDGEAYSVLLNQNSQADSLNISIINEEDDELFSQLLSQRELKEFFKQSLDKRYMSQTYQDGEFEIELLIYAGDYTHRSQVDGYLFINKTENLR